MFEIKTPLKERAIILNFTSKHPTNMTTKITKITNMKTRK